MKVIVTGGAGFIGSAVCRLFVGELGASVLNIDKLTYAANPASLKPIENSPNYTFRQVDIGDRATIAELMKAFQPDAMLHLAAESHVDRSIDGPGEFIATNIQGTYELLQARSTIGGPCRPSAPSGFAFTMSRPTRCSARSEPTANFTKPAAISRIRPMPHQRRPPTIWCGRGTRPSACRR